MENYGWSIELNPGYVLIIGNAPDAHIQLDSAYGRAVRVGLQVKDDISCAMLSEYSSSYNTLVNGKSIQRIATVKNHDFISIGDFTAYYNNGKIFFDYGAIRTNGVEVRPESLDIHTTYPVFIRNTRIQAKRDKTPIEILDPGTIPTKPELNLVTSLMPSIIMFALVVLLRGVMSKSNGAFVAFSICSMGVGVFTSIFGIINKQKKYKKDLVKRRDTYLEYIAKKRNEIEAARREELDCLNAQYYSIEQDIEHIENFDPVLFDRISTDEDFLEVYLGRGNVESLRQVDYKKQEKLEVGDDLSSLPEHVAGTTGSGKSEILQTFILGAATLFHPYEIGFVIIDFKGGGMVNQFRKLPHLIGAITNIDGKAIDRSLRSIKAELLKRQNLFAQLNVNHIDKYIKAYKEGQAKVALPHLVIIVDEFAELKAEQPEFMKELISAARIGRSLGVHLILATQKPAGQVNDQIWSNSKFKLCLKVQTQEDSNEVLKSPLAAEIKEPGRAYLQVGNNEIFELFQSGYSGSPESINGEDDTPFDIYELDFSGKKNLVYKHKLENSEQSRSQLEAVVEYVDKYCKADGVKKLPDICLPALEEVIVYDAELAHNDTPLSMTAVIGIYDDPDRQRQGRTVIEIGNKNTIIIGASQFGKTNLLELIVRNLAENYSPEELSIYIIDFASMVLKNFEKLAHVGGVVCPSDDERLKNLFKYLSEQIEERRERLLEAGVSSYTSYCEAGFTDIPQIVVLIDNYTALKELYLQDSDILLNLCREGGSVGISFIISNLQTTGLGYKYLANFSGRIAMFCNESSEYMTLYGSCKLRPDETAGRCLTEIDGEIYECQTFLAFEGTKEIERVNNMHAFVDQINAVYGDITADKIPEIPELLTPDYVDHTFRRKNDENIIGIAYDTVAPVYTDHNKCNIITISGADNMGRTNFIKYFALQMLNSEIDTHIYIADDFRRKLSDIGQENVSYDLDPDEFIQKIIMIEVLLEEKYKRLIHQENPEKENTLIIINSQEVYTAISDSKDALNALKNIMGKYKVLNVYLLFGAVPNAQIAYGSPDIYKMMKETKSILFFDNLDNCKIVDIPLAIKRKNQKKIEPGDAYYIFEDEVSKVRIPLVSD